MKTDIAIESHIKLLVDSFYKKAIADESLVHIFTDVAKVNWEHHLPVMYAFWESVLLCKKSYTGNPMENYFKLNEKIKLTSDHFNTWKFLFIQTVEENFEGEVANLAKEKARSIADLMFYKIHNHYNFPGIAQPKK